MICIIPPLLLSTMAVVVSSAFTTNIQPFQSSSISISTTALCSKRKNKPSMAERRKRRAKRTPGIVVDRPAFLDEVPAPKNELAESKSQRLQSDSKSTDASLDEESRETTAKASSLVESQRRSVDCLTFIRKRLEENFAVEDAVKNLMEEGYFFYDGLLSSESKSSEIGEGEGNNESFGNALLDEMLEEASQMLSNDKLERDISRLGDGEFVGPIVGGEKYADCPRLTEYVVSLTRHLPPLLNERFDRLEGSNAWPRLDASASMGSLRVYDRKTRLGAETLLAQPSSEDSVDSNLMFEVICKDAVEDSRRVTAMFFLASKESCESSYGGGIATESGEKIDAMRDRVILLRSDACSHSLRAWVGDDKQGLQQAASVVVHFVKERT